MHSSVALLAHFFFSCSNDWILYSFGRTAETMARHGVLRIDCVLVRVWFEQSAFVAWSADAASECCRGHLLVSVFLPVSVAIEVRKIPCLFSRF
jgi:hypothetical protein